MPSQFARRAIASIVPALSLGAVLLLNPATVVAGPNDDRVLPVDQYTSDKGRQLAATYDAALRTLNTHLYYCLPWVEVQRHSIGFYKPKNAEQDDRYLSVRLYIEQDPSPDFMAMPVEHRASAMFSRYVGSLLREMTRERRLLNDPAVGGFAVLLEWQKHGVRVESRPVHETIAVFVEKSLATRYLSHAITSRELAAKARVLGFDGETHLGPLKIAG